MSVLRSVRVAIVGGGIMGCSVAYRLSKSASSSVRFDVTIIEACEDVAVGASGKAGGFLARNWCDGEPMGPLVHASFDMHAAFAEEVGASTIGYRRLDTVSAGEASTSRRPPAQYLDGPGVSYSPIGNESNCVQVTPELLTRKLLELAQATGQVQLLLNSYVRGIRVEERKPDADPAGPFHISISKSPEQSETLPPFDHVVFACGAWAPEAASTWFPPDVMPQRFPADGKKITPCLATSIVLNPVAQPPVVSKHAVFSGLAHKHEGCDAEIYPRPDGTVYVCGFTSATPLTQTPATAPVNEIACEKLHKYAGQMMTCVAPGKMRLEKKQSCYLPIPPDGRTPLIGKLPLLGDLTGAAWIAAGHSCWGILNCHGTGVLIEQMISRFEMNTTTQATAGALPAYAKAFDPVLFMESAHAADSRRKNPASKLGGLSSTGDEELL